MVGVCRSHIGVSLNLVRRDGDGAGAGAGAATGPTPLQRTRHAKSINVMRLGGGND